jgi:hypothetical protein|tara:strand:+ start:148 stop:696 length:549 start_codon:yes stop_codon:yes gene_type:complete
MSLLKVNEVQNTSGNFDVTGVGKILQVISTTKTDSFSTNSNSYVDITGLSATITPQSGTKCYVTYHVVVGGVTGGWSMGIQLLRDTTAIGNGSQYNANNFYLSRGGTLTTESGYFMGGNMDYGFLDTHGANGSTAITYKLQMLSGYPQQPTFYLNRSGAGSGNYTYSPNYTASTITVMEVAA